MPLVKILFFTLFAYFKQCKNQKSVKKSVKSNVPRDTLVLLELQKVTDHTDVNCKFKN